MLSYRTFQRLYDGDYEWILEEYGVASDLSEAAIASGVFKSSGRGVIYKNIEMAYSATVDNTWVLHKDSKEWEKDKENKVILTDDGKNKLKDKFSQLRHASESDFAEKWSELFKSGTKNLVDIEANVNGKNVKLKISDFDKTKSFSKEMTPAERTARQESLSALAIKLADQLKSANLESVPPLPKELEKTNKYGEMVNGVFKVDPDILEIFRNYFWIDRSKPSPTTYVGKTFEQIMEFLYTDGSWINQAKKTVDSLFDSATFSQSVGSSEKSYQVHRGTDFMSNVYSIYKASAKNSEIDGAIIKDDKWNPGDVWMVDESKVEEMDKYLKEILEILGRRGDKLNRQEGLKEVLGIKSSLKPDIPKQKSFENTLHFYNWLIREWYDNEFLKGVSLKKFDEVKGPSIEHFNTSPKDEVQEIDVVFNRFAVGKLDRPFESKDIYLKFSVAMDDEEKEYSIQLRSFSSSIQAIQGEMKGENANHGKIGLGVIRFMMGIGKNDSNFRKWRTHLNQLYKRKDRSVTSTFSTNKKDLASFKRKFDKNYGSKEKNDTIQLAMKKMLSKRILILHNHLFNVQQKMKDWEDVAIDKLISKLQALEVCAWLKESEGVTTKFKDSDGDTIREADLIMKRMYFYATSRGNVETGAFSSKFMKIG